MQLNNSSRDEWQGSLFRREGPSKFLSLFDEKLLIALLDQMEDSPASTICQQKQEKTHIPFIFYEIVQLDLSNIIAILTKFIVSITYNLY